MSAALGAAALCSIVSAFAVALRAQQVEPGEQSAPTPIEQALMEHVCSVVPAGGGPESDRYLACLRTQLFSLRSDFGKDLSKLTPADRKAMDLACNEVRTASGRDAYLDCIGSQLTALRAKRNRAAALVPPLMPVPDGSTAAEMPAAPASPGTPASSSTGLLIGAGALIAVAAGGGGLLFLKTKRVSHKCRVCGGSVETSGDLCPACRHEAAETVRRAVAERAEQQRAQEDEQRRQKDQAVQEEEERLRKAREAEQMRVLRGQQREQEEARKREAEERRRQQEEARERRMMSGSDEFDPYEVLDVPRGASHDDIRAAYETAREKTDPSQVSHLSDEVQEHFGLKAKAVERAFQMLSR